MVEEEFSGFAELKAFGVELSDEVRVVEQVKQRPEFQWVALLAYAALGAGGPSFSLQGVDVALPAAARADGGHLQGIFVSS